MPLTQERIIFNLNNIWHEANVTSLRYYMVNYVLTTVFCFFQCQPSWTHLQCIVSKGEDPLPAEVRIKCYEENPDDFFYIDPKDWCYNQLLRKVYADPGQEGLRRIMGRALVRTFALFE